MLQTLIEVVTKAQHLEAIWKLDILQRLVEGCSKGQGHQFRGKRHVLQALVETRPEAKLPELQG